MSQADDLFGNRRLSLSLVLAFVLFTGAFPLAAMSGGAAPTVSLVNQKQSGAVNCPIAAGATFCSNVVTFSPSFTVVPSVTVTDVDTSGNNQAFFAGTTSFIATDPPVVWTGMPRALTEFLGTTNHRLAVDTSLGLTAVRFQAICTVASTNATAFIGIQESVDSGSTWTDLSTSFHLVISNTHCPGLVDSGLAGISIIASVNALFRVFGQNGNGAGDNPAFTSITFTTNGVINASPYHCTVDTAGGFPTTTTLIVLCLALSTQSVPITAKYLWQAEVI